MFLKKYLLTAFRECISLDKYIMVTGHSLVTGQVSNFAISLPH